MVKITVEGFKCNRCGHQWVPRFPDRKPPVSCAKCRSVYWDKPRTRLRTKKGQPSIRQLKRALDPRRQIVREELKETLEKEKHRGSGKRSD